MQFNKLIKRSDKILPLIDDRSKSRHISYLLYGNKIVSWGINYPWKSHPLGAINDARFGAQHSELNAIIKSKWKINELNCLTLVNLRFLRNGKLAMAKPCIPCQKLIIAFGINEVWYSNPDGIFERYR